MDLRGCAGARPQMFSRIPAAKEHVTMTVSTRGPRRSVKSDACATSASSALQRRRTFHSAYKIPAKADGMSANPTKRNRSSWVGTARKTTEKDPSHAVMETQ